VGIGFNGMLNKQISIMRTILLTVVLLVPFMGISQDRGTFNDVRDGKTYPWVRIGNQTWMAENLNYRTSDSWCYDNNESNCVIYGRLYTWYATMNGEASSNTIPSNVQGVCPQSWHLPSDEEWNILVNYLGVDHGGKMKESGTKHWNSPNTSATNSSGFTALPGGSFFQRSFQGLGYGSSWWSASEFSETDAFVHQLSNNYSRAFRGFHNKQNGFSIRCIKD